MPLILCHAPTGGVGTSFIAAHLSLGLAARGHQVTAVDFTHADALKLFFGMLPTQAVPEIGEADDEGIIVEGVELLQGYSFVQGGAMTRGGRGAGALLGDRVVVADVASADLATRDALLPLAALHLCVLMPQPVSLAGLARVRSDVAAIDLESTAFVLNQADDTRKLSRHSQLFLRELFDDRMIAAVRRDEAVNEALASFQPIARYAPQSVVLPDLAALAVAIEARCGLTIQEDAA
ncbi:cellulose synthase operon protein YhjQ/BcsQ [Sphingomonas silueang]|uniref:cellulose synthase operon protein YhjQ/BcsQ n=1 Tax=Sphingomonas silueang TaxID=3156617 RepID=UPI0032B32AB3